MSDVKEKDKELKKLSREILTKQIEESSKVINQAQQNVMQIQQQIEQQRGVLAYAQHLLAQFDIPEAPKEDPKKTPELEVK